VCANLYTGKWHNGRQLRGRHFLGPVATGVYSITGGLSGSADSKIRTGYEAMTSGLGPRLCVYSRPNPEMAKAAFYEDVTAVKCKQRPSYLRSRA
jgi:hypothetical protein